MPEALDEQSLHLPADLLRSVLRITDLAELKIVLIVAQRSLGGRRPVPHADLISAPVVRIVAGVGSPEPAESRVAGALARAVVNRHLLRFSAGTGSQPRHFYLVPTVAGRALFDALRRADAATISQVGLPDDASISIYRPNLFAFYEEYLGPLTPLVAEQLRDAERSYPRAWVEDAIRTAAESGSQSWRFIQAVLSRWEETGSPGSVDVRTARGR